MISRRRELLEKLLSQRRGSPSQEGDIQARTVEGNPYPLTYEQLRIWLQYKISPDAPVYNFSRAFRLYGKIRIEALKQALTTIITRHHILRTVYLEIDGVPKQQVRDPWELEMDVVDLRMVESHQREQRLASLLDHHAYQAFDLQKDLPIRAILYLMDEGCSVFQIVCHHIAIDARSMEFIYAELAAFYALYQGEDQKPLPAPTLQYADYALWQLEYLKQAQHQKDLDFWSHHLAEAPSELALPREDKVMKPHTFDGERYALELSAPLTQALKGYSTRQSTTLFMTMLAAMYVWLWRYTGQTDLVIGVPVDGRKHLQLQEMIGCFVNTLPLRIQIEAGLSFRALLGKVRKLVWEALDHQHIPIELMIQTVRPKRGADGHVLYHVMLDFLTGAISGFRLPGMDSDPVELKKCLSMFDFTLMVRADGGAIELNFEYARSLFSLETIKRMAGHYVNLLQAILDDDTRSIGQLPLLGVEEFNRTIYAWNVTHRPYPWEGGVHRLMESQVSRTPQRVAVREADQSLTYAQLNADANRLARYLRAQGVKNDMVVGLLMPRSLHLATAILAVLKAGGAYLPIDEDFPEARVRAILQDSRCHFVLTAGRSDLPALLPETEVIDIQDSAERWKEYSAKNLTNEVSGENLAYVIFTSGSTGRPKGVMVTHRALDNHMRWMQETFPLSESDKVFQKTPLSFDASVWEFFAPWIAGGELVLAKPKGHQDVRYLIETIQKEHITILQTVPTLLRLLLEMEDFARCTSLRRVFCGGELLDAALVERFYRRMRAELINLYGPSEACINTTTWKCTQGEDRVPIGKPIANAENYVLDTELNPCPIGVIGELFIAGAALGRGYIHQPALTAERFIPDPFSSRGARMYRTGDLARYLPDGAIEFMGRRDFQIKLRGYRIELGEIEALLRSYLGVKDAVVALQGETMETARLVAYIVPQPNVNLSAQDVLAYLRNSLPEYMLPNGVVFLSAFPLTSSGKVDRRALPAYTGEPVGETDIEEPHNALEKALAILWAQVLGVEQVGRTQSFFDLGGQSLLAMRLAAEIGEMFQVKIPLSMIFEYPSVAAMAEAITSLGKPLAHIQEMAELFIEVSSLSDEEIEARLRLKNEKE